MSYNIYIPEKIKVGYVERQDTYSKKLAYVIYYDGKGVLRKEVSFENWRNKTIPCEDFKNEPISGFVLNKNVGGVRHSYNWNARNEKIRVYDPRGFEFEISVNNLLFILDYCTSIKGKGIEGELVYGWSDKELVLIPINSEEYINSLRKTELYNLPPLKIKDLVVGESYVNKYNDEFIYMGVQMFNEDKGKQYFKSHNYEFLHDNKIDDIKNYRGIYQKKCKVIYDVADDSFLELKSGRLVDKGVTNMDFNDLTLKFDKSFYSLNELKFKKMDNHTFFKFLYSLIVNTYIAEGLNYYRMSYYNGDNSSITFYKEIEPNKFKAFEAYISLDMGYTDTDERVKNTKIPKRIKTIVLCEKNICDITTDGMIKMTNSNSLKSYININCNSIEEYADKFNELGLNMMYLEKEEGNIFL